MLELIRRKIIESLASPVPAFVRRDLYVPAIPGNAIAVIGMRRTGKSTFLWQILSDRLSQGMERESLLYFDFEDERLAGLKFTDLQLLIEEYRRLYPRLRNGSRTVWSFDGIQVVQG